MAGNLAPTPGFPEQAGVNYETGRATPTPGRRGPLRFQEGLVTDPNVPSGFLTGAGQGYDTGPHDTNRSVYIKSAAETMSERSHPGSAAWTESPTFLGEFGHGVSPAAEVKYETVQRDGGHYQRVAPTVIRD
ncbi:hypothetical protein [Streptomyces sp. NPDC017448]|uniref:hypothetical protein n=1 Tax=Streptomyces sp. NPDC017448 TaxID=3364996 RepID=UPI0037919649